MRLVRVRSLQRTYRPEGDDRDPRDAAAEDRQVHAGPHPPGQGAAADRPLPDARQDPAREMPDGLTRRTTAASWSRSRSASTFCRPGASGGGGSSPAPTAAAKQQPSRRSPRTHPRPQAGLCAGRGRDRPGAARPAQAAREAPRPQAEARGARRSRRPRPHGPRPRPSCPPRRRSPTPTAAPRYMPARSPTHSPRRRPPHRSPRRAAGPRRRRSGEFDTTGEPMSVSEPIRLASQHGRARRSRRPPWPLVVVRRGDRGSARSAASLGDGGDAARSAVGDADAGDRP